MKKDNATTAKSNEERLKNDEYSLERFFKPRYDLPYKPAAYTKDSYFAWFKRKGLLPLAILLCIFILPPIFFSAKESGKYGAREKKRKEWQQHYDYREQNWNAAFDAFLEEKKHAINVYESALAAHGIEEDDVQGISKELNFDSVSYDGYWRKYQAGNVRASRYDLTQILVTQNEILCYTRTLDLFDPDADNASTIEYFLKDVTGIGTVTKTKELPDTGSEEDGTEADMSDEANQKQVAISTNFILSVPGDSYEFYISGDGKKNKAIMNLKNVIREAKQNIVKISKE